MHPALKGSLWSLAVAVAALLMVSPAQAGLNGDVSFTTERPFADEFEGDFITVVSGKLDYEVAGQRGPYAFFETGGFTIDGLQQVCFNLQCHTSGSYRIVVSTGDSVALDFPDPVSLGAEADHALGVFVDFRDDKRFAHFDVEESLAFAAVEGDAIFEALPGIPISGAANCAEMFGADQELGRLGTLQDDVSVRVEENGAPIGTVTQKDRWVCFAGQPEISSISGSEFVLPFETGASASFSPASGSAAAEGIDFDRIQQLVNTIDGAYAGDAQSSEDAEDVGPNDKMEGLFQEILDGAVMTVPTGDNSTDRFEDDFLLIRFENMRVEPALLDGVSGLRYSGDAALYIEQGSVRDAPGMYGFWVFQFPWWSYLLWVVGLGVWTTRMAMKVPTKNDRWDRLWWIGLVAGILMTLLVFFLWDLEVRSVWGTSLLTTDTSGTALLFVLGITVAPMALAAFAVAAPMKLIISNGLMLGRQGKFMGLAWPLSILLGYLIGFSLLLGQLDVILGRIVDGIA